MAFESNNIIWLCIILTGIVWLCLAWHFNKKHKHWNQMLNYLIEAIENHDYTIRFNEKNGNKETRLMHIALNKIEKLLHQTQTDIVEKEKFFEHILDCVSTGIVIVRKDGSVMHTNNEAMRLLGLDIFTHIKQIGNADKSLQELMLTRKTDDKLYYDIHNERGEMKLSIRISHISVKDEVLNIVVLSDIHNELNEQEIESWMRLTRVMTHEIMNSVAPITSLCDTLLNQANGQIEKDVLVNGLQTIHDTGKGLMDFVESYRKFTRIPTPKPTLFYLKPLVERIVTLTEHQYPQSRIHFDIAIHPDELILYADEHLIAQVLNNVIRNATQSIMENKLTEGIITIHAYCNETEAVIIDISNNGPSIPHDVAEHIFIPFFSTKKHGNGIGLSVSRQIMRLSNGTISLLPTPKTTFRLQFN